MDSIGRTLREDISAERNQPPFNRVTMDGIAINYPQSKKPDSTYQIESTHFAGDAPKKLINKNQCIEVMTGSVLPANTNCVIPIECVVIENQIAKVEKNYTARKWQFIHKEGTDHKKNDVVLKKGHKITPIDIALILSCGKANVVVSEEPKIRILSTGSELIPTGMKILPHQIRITNGPSMITMLKEQCFHDCEHFHLIDDREVQKKEIKKYLKESNVLILSGGISMGKADYVEKILEELGVQCVFYKVKQRPGKPMWFGVGPKKQLVFALPGNPVSAITCCRHYIIHALRRMSGTIKKNNEYVQLRKKITSKTKFTHFLPVKLMNTKTGTRQALAIKTNTSGDFTSLSGTHGYIELKANQEVFNQGHNVIFYDWDHP